MNLQQEYNNVPAEEAPVEQPQAQDMVLPGAAAAQIAQYIQAGDCQSVCKIMSELMVPPTA